MFGMSMDIGIDLGTANVLVYVKRKGIVLKEPSVVAVNRDTNQVLAIGEDARRMIGRTPGNIVAIRPLRDGVIADYDITESMLRFFIEKVVGRSIVFRPRIMICIPSGVTMVEQRAVQEAAEQAGARHIQLIEEPRYDRYCCHQSRRHRDKREPAHGGRHVRRGYHRVCEA